MRFDPGRERRLTGATRLQGNGRGIPERSMLLLQGHVSLLATFTIAEAFSSFAQGDGTTAVAVRPRRHRRRADGTRCRPAEWADNHPPRRNRKIAHVFVNFEINLDEFNKALRVPGIWAETETTVKGNLLCKVDCTSGLR